MKSAFRAAIATTLALLLTFSMPFTALAALTSADPGEESNGVLETDADSRGLVWKYRVEEGHIFIVGFDVVEPEPEVPDPVNDDEGDELVSGGESESGDGGVERSGESGSTDGANTADDAADTDGPAENNASERDESDGGEGEDVYEPFDPSTIAIPDEVTIDGEPQSVYGVSTVDGGNPWGEVVSITFAEGISEIDEDTFLECEKLESATFAEGSKLKTLGKRAFKESGITEISLPSSAAVSTEAFFGCPNLESFTYMDVGTAEQNLTPFGQSAFKGCRNLQYVQILASTTEIPSQMFQGCAKLGRLTLKNVVKIGNSAFDGCTELSLVSLSEGLKEIGEGAFAGSGLKSMTVPSTVQAISKKTFDGCTELSAVSLSEGLKEIGEGAFAGSGLKSMTVPSTVQKIGENAFDSCEELSDLVFSEPDGSSDLRDIADGAFGNCARLVSVALPQNPSKEFVVLGDGAFRGAAIGSISIPSSVEEIGIGTFAECKNLTSVVGCKGVKQIDERAFSNTSLAAISDDIFKNVKLIHKTAFEGCGVDEYLKTHFDKGGIALEDEGMVYIRNDAHVQISGSLNYKYAQELLGELNKELSEENMLAMDGELLEAAMQRAWELPVYYGEKRPNGLSYSLMPQNINLNKKNSMQLCTLVYDTSTTAAEAILNSVVKAADASKTVKEIIKGGGYQSAGVGCAIVGGTYYWVVLLCEESARVPGNADGNGSIAYLGKQPFTKRVGLNADFTNALPDMQKKQLLVKPVSSTSSWKAGQQVQLEYLFKGTNVDLPSTVKFTTTDSSVATVDPAGLVTFKKGGTVTVSASLEGLPASYRAYYTFDVAALKSLKGTTVSGLTKKTYTGSALTQDGVVVKSASGDVTLVQGKDYEISKYEDNINVGTAKLYINGINDYGGAAYVTFPILKASQPMKLARVAKKITSKKGKTVRVVKVTKAKGSVTYSNASTTKSSKKLKVNKKTGKVKIPAKMKAGTYKLIVQAKVNGKVNGLANYESATKKVSLKIRVR